MCKCCNLVSGEEIDIGNAKQQTLFIERHNNTYSITTKIENYIEEDEVDIKYCPMCGRKLGGNNER